jgi:hypothetical protein
MRSARTAAHRSQTGRLQAVELLIANLLRKAMGERLIMLLLFQRIERRPIIIFFGVVNFWDHLFCAVQFASAL